MDAKTPVEKTDEFAEFTDEMTEVFARHGIIGVVAFVRVSDVKCLGNGKYDFQWEGQATVIASPEIEPVAVAAGLDSLERKQDLVATLLAQTKREITADAERVRATFPN